MGKNMSYEQKNMGLIWSEIKLKKYREGRAQAHQK